MKSTMSINYVGFHPSSWTESYLESKVSRMQDLAPYGAVIDAHFRRKGPEFHCVIQIHSAAGAFFAKSSGRKIKDVASNLQHQILHQLGKWKHNRFDRGHKPEYREETEQSA